MRFLIRFALVLHLAVGSLYAQDTAPRSGTVEQQLHRAERAWLSGASVWEAKARVDRVLEVDPANASALRLRAQIRLAQNDRFGAYDDARRALAAHPDADAYALVAETAFATGDTVATGEALAQAARLLLDVPQAHLALAVLAERARLFQQAEAYARIVHTATPTAATHLLLARLLVAQGRDDAAGMLLARALEQGLTSIGSIERDTLLAPLAQKPPLRRQRR